MKKKYSFDVNFSVMVGKRKKFTAKTTLKWCSFHTRMVLYVGDALMVKKFLKTLTNALFPIFSCFLYKN